jgi:hypothetical protein
MRIRNAIAALAGALALGTAVSARAGGDIQIDTDLAFPPHPTALCTLGSPCAGINYGLTIDGVNTLYLYQEGVIGFGAQLSGSVAGGLASLTGGDYLALAFGAPVQSATYTEMITNFSGAGPGVVFINLFTKDASNVFGFLQLNIHNNAYNSVGQLTGNNTATLSFRYGQFGCGFAIGGACGFDANSDAGYKVDGMTTDYGVGTLPYNQVSLTLPLGPHPGVPEPGVWMLLVGGLGMAGAALRRARHITHTA